MIHLLLLLLLLLTQFTSVKVYTAIPFHSTHTGSCNAKALQGQVLIGKLIIHNIFIFLSIFVFTLLFNRLHLLQLTVQLTHTHLEQVCVCKCLDKSKINFEQKLNYNSLLIRNGGDFSRYQIFSLHFNSYTLYFKIIFSA